MEDKSNMRAPLTRKLHPLDEKLYFENFKSEVKIQKPYITLIEENWKSGFTVALVNLPLCIALAVASGATPSIGILSGIVGGVVSGLMGGSDYNIVGPTGALSGFLMLCVLKYGLSSLPYFAMVTGGCTLLMKKYELANYIDLFPSSVIEGFTLGIACIIFFNQINPALGINVKASQEAPMPVESPTHVEATLIDNLISTFLHIDQLDISSLFIYLIFFCGLYYLCQKYSTIPWQIVAALLGILIGYSKIFAFQTLGSKFGNFKLNFYDFTYLKTPSIKFFFDPRLWIDSLPIAFITVLETLISAKVADGMTGTHFDKKAELNALGVSNIITGLIGGLPITAALARTSLNIKSGASNKMSSLINGVLLFVISFLFIGMFRYLPLCVAAAQVSIVAVRMVNTHEIQVFYENDKKNFCIYMITAVICVIEDPTIGIIFGMLIYLILFSDSIRAPCSEIISTSEIKVKQIHSMRNLKDFNMNDMLNDGKVSKDFLYENLNMIVSDLPEEDSDYILYRVIGIINFMNVEEHCKKIKILINSQKSTLIISLKYLNYIDYEATCAIKHLLESIADGGENNIPTNKIILMGLSKERMETFENKEWIIDLHNQGALIHKEKEGHN